MKRSLIQSKIRFLKKVLYKVKLDKKSLIQSKIRFFKSLIPSKIR